MQISLNQYKIVCMICFPIFFVPAFFFVSYHPIIVSLFFLSVVRRKQGNKKCQRAFCTNKKKSEQINILCVYKYFTNLLILFVEDNELYICMYVLEEFKTFFFLHNSFQWFFPQNHLPHHHHYLLIAFAGFFS